MIRSSVAFRGRVGVVLVAAALIASLVVMEAVANLGGGTSPTPVPSVILETRPAASTSVAGRRDPPGVATAQGDRSAGNRSAGTTGAATTVGAESEVFDLTHGVWVPTPSRPAQTVPSPTSDSSAPAPVATPGVPDAPSQSTEP